jgi:hypothetical protein
VGEAVGPLFVRLGQGSLVPVAGKSASTRYTKFLVLLRPGREEVGLVLAIEFVGVRDLRKRRLVDVLALQRVVGDLGTGDRVPGEVGSNLGYIALGE